MENPPVGIKVGVLALQGASRLHLETLASIDVDAIPIKHPDDLATVDRLIIPGGESTTISKLLEFNGLRIPIAQRIAGGMPVLGTCAGMILLATDVFDGRIDQRSFGAIDVSVRRNGWGRQLDSFEGDIEMPIIGDQFHAVFIRAPRIERIGADVEVLATIDGEAIAVRQANAIATSFHPELTDDTRIHRWFVNEFEIDY